MSLFSNGPWNDFNMLRRAIETSFGEFFALMDKRAIGRTRRVSLR
jgi:hypothetical protein